MQEKLKFEEDEELGISDLLKTKAKDYKYNQDFINKSFNIKVITNRNPYTYAFPQATLDECIEYISNLDTVSVDIETTRKFNGTMYSKEGLDPYTSSIVMFQVGDLNRQYVIDTRDVDIQELVDILPSKTVVGHNLKFEYKHILHNYGVKLNKVYDTMIVEKILYNGYNLRNGLKDLNQRYLDIKVDKSTRLGFLFIRQRDYSFKEIKYGAEDILYPLLIKEQQELEISRKDLKNCIDLEFEFMKVLGDMEYKGLGFNKDVWMKTYDDNVSKFDTIREQLNQWVFDNNVVQFIDTQYDMFNTEMKCTINWGSSNQVIKLFKHLKICPIEKSKTTKQMTYTVEAKVLRNSFNNVNKDISDANELLINTYLKYKEIEQACTTFGESFLKYVHPLTNRIHCDFNQLVNTGRMSSRSPNLQNIPAALGFRKAFDCDDTKNIINADYSGQESVVLANQSQDSNMVDFYLNGDGDLHAYVATKMFRIIDNDPDLLIPPKELPDGSDNPAFKKEHKGKRQAAKAINFKLAYGGSAYTLKDDFKVDEETAQDFIDTYFDAFPGLRKFFSRSKKKSLREGYIEIDPITKRKFFFSRVQELPQLKLEKEWKEYFYLKGKYERASVNYKIQGTAGSITKKAGVLFRKWIIENDLEDVVFITNIIHDEINIESYKKYSERAAKALEDCMEEAGKAWCTTVPLKAGAVITNYWTH